MDGTSPAKKCTQIEQLVQRTAILDSNIWMNPELDAFFRRLRTRLNESSRTLTLFGPQFDEMCNIKDREPFASKKGRLARLALSRIETLQELGMLRVDPLVLQADPKAYADPLILILIHQLTSKGEDVHFVSDDRELRIRVREFAKDDKGLLDVCTSDCFKK